MLQGRKRRKMKEIVTIQVGGFANFIGSHFWNFQDETLGLAEQGYEDPMVPTSGLNMDVLYRVGETRQRRPTYTPRLLSLDLRGSSGAVSSSGSLYERRPSAQLPSVTSCKKREMDFLAKLPRLVLKETVVLVVNRHGPAVTFRSEPHQRNKFLQSLDEEEDQWLNASDKAKHCSEPASGTTPGNEDVHMLDSNEKEQSLVESLEEGVEFWTDYLKTHLHPSSLFEIPGVWHGVTPFGDYGCGNGLLSGEEQAEDIRNKVRLIVEECDHMQGFQLLVDDSGGFTPIAADLLDDVVEEYGRTPIFLFNVRQPDDLPSPSGSLTRNLHDAVSLARLSSVAHLTVPLGLPQVAQSAFSKHLVIKDGNKFHSSAVYAAAINCITLPFRMEVAGPLVTSQVAGVGSTDMGTSLRLVSCSTARRVGLIEAAFPAPAIAGNEGAYNLHKLSSLTPSTGLNSNRNEVAEMLVVQGARLTDSRGPATVLQVQDSLARASERLARSAMNPRRGLVLSHVAISPCPLAIPLPFPSIFSSTVGRYGDILSRPLVSTIQGRGGLDVISSPVTARISTGKAILPYIKKRSEDMQRLGLSRSTAGSAVLEDWGFAREEVQELSETLSGMQHAYGDTNGSDSSDND